MKNIYSEKDKRVAAALGVESPSAGSPSEGDDKKSANKKRGSKEASLLQEMQKSQALHAVRESGNDEGKGKRTFWHGLFSGGLKMLEADMPTRAIL